MAISGGGTGAQSVATLLPTTSGEALTKGDAVHISSTDGKYIKQVLYIQEKEQTFSGLQKRRLQRMPR